MAVITPHSADRIPSLDGLRAISITLVLVSHLAGTRHFAMSAAQGNIFALGELGVHVFFVISGYLITRLLLEELDRRQHISIGRFYLRRTLRIFPPYYTLIAVLVAAQAAGWLELAPHDAVRALTYTSNYDAGRSWYIGHTWSLSVEEQFYLLWPAVIILAGTRRAIVVAACAVLLAPIIRVGSWELMRWAADGIGHRFETVADAIAIGCLLAGTRAWLHRSRMYMRALASPLFAIVPLAVLGANLLHDHPVVYFGLGFTIVNLGVVACLDWCVTYADGSVGRALNAAPLVFVGQMSYSLYLWQQLFLNRASPSAAASFPLNIVLAVAAALASFFVIEQPALRLRRRIEAYLKTRASRATPEGPPEAALEIEAPPALGGPAIAS
jgi:peptidoglycan/LPS O-acetylase OafA/YrhL